LALNLINLFWIGSDELSNLLEDEYPCFDKNDK
jgi:hypothetical protein